MKNILKNKAVTIVILLATLVLAGIAVFTAIRLYQLRQESVAPNVPSSEPQAIQTTDTPPAACTQLSFTLATVPPGACAFTVAPSALSLKVGESKDFTIDVEGDPGEIPAVGGDWVSSSDTSVATVSRSFPLCLPNTNCPAYAYKVTALKVGSATINVESISEESDGSPLCTADVKVDITSGTASPTATPTASPTPLSCNNSCLEDIDCQAGLVCSSGNCRHTSCTLETDCDCSVATATPTATPQGPFGTNPPGTQETLPPTGINFPTIMGAGLGILVILGAILLLI